MSSMFNTDPSRRGMLLHAHVATNMQRYFEVW